LLIRGPYAFRFGEPIEQPFEPKASHPLTARIQTGFNAGFNTAIIALKALEHRRSI
jgi:hypothetical protein